MAGKRASDLIGHLAMADIGGTEIAAQHMTEVIAVLHDQRLVETNWWRNSAILLRCRIRAEQKHRRGIPRHQVEDGEDQDRNAEEHHDGADQALSDVPNHRFLA